MTTTFPAWLSAYLRIPMALAVVLLTLHCAHCRLWGRKDLGTSGNETELTETSIEALSTSRLYSLYILCTNDFPRDPHYYVLPHVRPKPIRRSTDHFPNKYTRELRRGLQDVISAQWCLLDVTKLIVSLTVGTERRKPSQNQISEIESRKEQSQLVP